MDELTFMSTKIRDGGFLSLFFPVFTKFDSEYRFTQSC